MSDNPSRIASARYDNERRLERLQADFLLMLKTFAGSAGAYDTPGARFAS